MKTAVAGPAAATAAGTEAATAAGSTAAVVAAVATGVTAAAGSTATTGAASAAGAAATATLGAATTEALAGAAAGAGVDSAPGSTEPTAQRERPDTTVVPSCCRLRLWSSSRACCGGEGCARSVSHAAARSRRAATRKARVSAAPIQAPGAPWAAAAPQVPPAARAGALGAPAAPCARRRAGLRPLSGVQRRAGRETGRARERCTKGESRHELRRAQGAFSLASRGVEGATEISATSSRRDAPRHSFRSAKGVSSAFWAPSLTTGSASDALAARCTRLQGVDAHEVA